MSAKRKKFLLLAVVAVVCGVTLWAWLGRQVPPVDSGRVTAPTPQSGTPKTGVATAQSPGPAPTGTPPFTTFFTVERLSLEHERAPTPDEWKELTRILLHAPEGEMVEVVKARFSVYSGTKELSALAEAYDNPVDDNTRQRVIDIFSTLQSEDFMDGARQVLNDQQMPISDPLVCASALSLARRGEASDIEAIFKRLNGAGEDPVPEGSLYSEADGLIGALCSARAPELESLFTAAATGQGVATTNRARAAAAAALRHFPTVPVTEVLYDLSKTDPNVMVRNRAQMSLKAIQTKE